MNKRSSDTFDQWPFDHPFFLILNVAVGGQWPEATGVADSSTWSENPTKMIVDYVRVLQKSPPITAQNSILFPKPRRLLQSALVRLNLNTGQSGQNVRLVHSNDWANGLNAIDNGNGTYSVFNFQMTNQIDYKWVVNDVYENFSVDPLDASYCQYNRMVAGYSNRQWQTSDGLNIMDTFNTCRN